MASVTFMNNSITIVFESWLVPIDILMIINSSLVIGFATLFLFIIVYDRTYYTIPMMLIGNSCLAELLLASNAL
jgi:hypothetical protein